MRLLASIAMGLAAAWTLAGCAARPMSPATQRTTLPTSRGTTLPADHPAMLPLDKIEPVPVLGAPRRAATTKPAPLDSLQWYAQARAAMLANPPQKATAIRLLEKAAAADPNSPEIYEELGKAYGAEDKAVAAYEKALELDPDNLDLHARLARQHLVRSRTDEAIRHFRLATLTTEYREDNDEAATVDFFLARALQQKGYDRAALDRYVILLKRLEQGAPGWRAHTEIVTLSNQPELLWSQVGELYEKHGQYDEAVKAFRIAAQRVPENFDFNARLAKVLLLAGQMQEALDLAASLVSRFRANSDSLNLLRDMYKSLGRESDQVEALKKLRREKPGDRALLFALTDTLLREKRAAEAEAMLKEAAHKTADMDIVKRLFGIYDQREDSEAAVRLLIETLARDPDSLRQMSSMWGQLLRPSRRRQLRLGLIQKLKVEPALEPARLFFVSRVAEVWNRDALARSALEQAVAIKPRFAPVCRVMVADYWSRPDWEDSQKIQMCDKLVRAVRSEGNAALAAELEALSLLHQKNKGEEAAKKLEESIKLGNKSPDVQHTQAAAMLAAGEGARAESLLWKVISDWPVYDEAYETLFGYYLGQSQPSRAVNVLAKWLAADPGNLRARLWRVRVMSGARRGDAAESELLSLFRDDPHDAQVLAVMQSFYVDQGRIERFISVLEDERKAHPDNREAAEMLVTIYHHQKRLPEALRVLDATRDAVKNDADLLYYVAHVYGRIGEKKTEEKLLEDALKLDAKHAPSANDLGYGWADEGRNLARAEELIRIAVEAEPDNQSFLDSLGWVLYKRSKFAEARAYFEKALGPATRPDPVVLDHMGDVLYRLGQKDAAIKQWRWAARRLDERGAGEREDLKKLRLDLQAKFRQFESNQPVTVAPVAEGEKK